MQLVEFEVGVGVEIAVDSELVRDDFEELGRGVVPRLTGAADVEGRTESENLDGVAGEDGAEEELRVEVLSSVEARVGVELAGGASLEVDDVNALSCSTEEAGAFSRPPRFTPIPRLTSTSSSLFLGPPSCCSFAQPSLDPGPGPFANVGATRRAGAVVGGAC